MVYIGDELDSDQSFLNSLRYKLDPKIDLNTLFPLRSIMSELPLIVLPYIVLVDLKYSQNFFLTVILMD